MMKWAIWFQLTLRIELFAEQFSGFGRQSSPGQLEQSTVFLRIEHFGFEDARLNDVHRNSAFVQFQMAPSKDDKNSGNRRDRRRICAQGVRFLPRVRVWKSVGGEFRYSTFELPSTCPRTVFDRHHVRYYQGVYRLKIYNLNLGIPSQLWSVASNYGVNFS